MPNDAILHFDDNWPGSSPGLPPLPNIGALIRQLNDILEAAKAAQTDTENARDAAETSEGNAEAWAVGERAGHPVPSTDPAFANNAKFYAQVAGQAIGESGYLYFLINEDGDLIMVRTEYVPVTFHLDDGDLIMEADE